MDLKGSRKAVTCPPFQPLGFILGLGCRLFTTTVLLQFHSTCHQCSHGSPILLGFRMAGHLRPLMSSWVLALELLLALKIGTAVLSKDIFGHMTDLPASMVLSSNGLCL